MIDPVPGRVIEYPYLWRWQERGGETEGRKARPTCLVIAVKGKGDGLTHLALLAISSTAPLPGQTVVDIPATERRRAGLDPDRPAWITVSEWNHDIMEHSFYLTGTPHRCGRFSDGFLRQVMAAFRPFLGNGDRVDRR